MTVSYFKEDNSPDLWLAARACAEIDMEFLAIYTHEPTVILSIATPYSVINIEEMKKRGIGLKRVFVLPSSRMCAGFLDDGILSWILFVEVGNWTKNTFLTALVDWQAQALLDEIGVSIELGPGGSVLMLKDKAIGIVGVDDNHDGYLLGAGTLNLVVDTSIPKDLNVPNVLEGQIGLNQLGHRITIDQLRNSMENTFESFFGRTLDLTSIDVIKDRVDELKDIYHSEAWIEHGEQ